MSEEIILYTDGSALGNPGPGGLGVVLKFNDFRKEISRGFRNTTNNRMELLAVITGLEALKTNKYPVSIFSDSEYVINAIKNNWLANWRKKEFKKIKNPDLWQKYIKVSENFHIKYHWVKGHSGNTENERCDILAKNAASNPTEIDNGYEQSLTDSKEKQVFNFKNPTE